MAISYGKFVGELNKGIEGMILSYDKQESTDRCVIHLKTTGQKIFIEEAVIHQAREEAISILRAKLRAGLGDAPVLALRLRDGSLILEDEGVSL